MMIREYEIYFIYMLTTRRVPGPFYFLWQKQVPLSMYTHTMCVYIYVCIVRYKATKATLFYYQDFIFLRLTYFALKSPITIKSLYDLSIAS